MQQLQPLKSSSGPLGLAPGRGKDRDRHQPCCGISLETAPPAQRLDTDCSGTGGTRDHSLTLCSGHGKSVVLRTTPSPVPGDAGATTLPLQQVTDPPSTGGRPQHPLTRVRHRVWMWSHDCSALSRSLGAGGEGGGLMPQLWDQHHGNAP